MTIALTATPDTVNAQIAFAATGLFPMDQFTITRTNPDGSIVNCREATTVATGGSSTWNGYDHECPLGAAVTYTLNATQHDGSGNVIASGSASAGPVTIAVAPGTAWLKDFVQPAMNTPVTVTGIDEIIRKARVQTYEVIGRANPVAISDVRSGRSGTLRFMTVDATGRANMQALFATGRVLFFQATPADGFDDLIFIAGDVTSVRKGISSDPTRLFVVPFTEADLPSGLTTALPGNSYLAVTNWASYSALLAARTNYLDVLNRPYGS